MARVVKYTALLILLAGMVYLFKPEEPQRLTSSGRVRVEFWMATGAHEEFPVSVRLFNESQDSIEVVPVAIPWKENEKKILTAILSGKPPDVISQFSPIGRWAARRALMPLDAFITRDRFDTTVFYPPLWAEMKWEGKAFGIPSAGSCYGLFYNRRLFRQAGLDPDRPPRTWEELRRYAERLTLRDERGRIVQAGFIPNYSALAAAVVMAFQKGATFRSADLCSVRLDEAPVVEALRWTVDYYDHYGLAELTALHLSCGINEQHGFNSERVAMMILDNSHVNQIRRFAPHLDYGISLIPCDAGDRPATQVGSFWLAIPRGAKSAAAAWEFLKFTARMETQLHGFLAEKEPLVPSNRLVAHQKAFLERMPQMAIFDSLMYQGFGSSLLPLVHDVFWREYFLAMEMALNHRLSPEEALRQANQRVQKQLDEAAEYDQYVRKKMPWENYGQD
ncbi:MAG: ABC transporter substrate-binding protein [bacterium]|nr:ABC transporter substrate-binding protein [candidate division KSB1 bacterium]MDH7560317.1 ABC transporter substrate-binding protein [bacterium]